MILTVLQSAAHSWRTYWVGPTHSVATAISFHFSQQKSIPLDWGTGVHIYINMSCLIGSNLSLSTVLIRYIWVRPHSQLSIPFIEYTTTGPDYNMEAYQHFLPFRNLQHVCSKLMKQSYLKSHIQKWDLMLLLTGKLWGSVSHYSHGLVNFSMCCNFG